MSNKTAKINSKQSFESVDSKPTSRKSVSVNEKCSKTIARPKKVILSKVLPTTPFPEAKSCSTSTIKHPEKTKAKKTAKSDANFRKNNTYSGPRDCVRRCGDTVHNDPEITKKRPTEQAKSKSRKTSRTKVQQYYKNENFQTTDSIHDLEDKFRNISTLSTIRETLEQKSKSTDTTNDDLFKIYTTESSEELGFIDPNDNKVIESIKQFREANYFECHSSKARTDSKGSATSLTNHKCVYRFYLNERLFPVSLATDHENNIRCVECNLPYTDTDNNTEGVNGTIQAKVAMDSEVADITMLLPVRRPLIITERRKEKMKPKDEIMYFGVIKLNDDFVQSFNSDSLALRHQRGYKKYVRDSLKYQDVKKDDVIII